MQILSRRIAVLCRIKRLYIVKNICLGYASWRIQAEVTQCTRTHGLAVRTPSDFYREGAVWVWEVVTLISFAVAGTSVLVTVLENAARSKDRPKNCNKNNKILKTGFDKKKEECSFL